MRRLVTGSCLALAVFAAMGAGCSDLLGFKTFTEDKEDGGPSSDGSFPSGTVDATSPEAGPPEAGPPEAGSPEAGPSGSKDAGSPSPPSSTPCTPSCSAGQKCENGTCVCDPTTCTGCCSGTACSTSWPGCGTGGGACTACDSLTDRCGAGQDEACSLRLRERLRGGPGLRRGRVRLHRGLVQQWVVLRKHVHRHGH